MSSPPRSGPSPLLLGLAAFTIVVAGLRAAAPIVVPFLLALFVAVVCAAPLFTLEKRGVPRWVGLPLVVIGVVLVFAGIGTLIGTSVNDFTRQLPAYETRFRVLLDAGAARLEELGAPSATGELRDVFQPGQVFGLVRGLLAGLGAALTNAFFVLLTAVFVLLEATSLRDKLEVIADDPGDARERFELIADNVRRYLGVKTLTSLATGGLIAAGLALLGVDFPLLWGLLAFLLNFVPTIGSVIAGVPGVLLALVQLGWGPALAATLLYVGVNVAIGNGIEPRLMGRSVGLSTLVVFVSLVFWGWVLGPVGMLLSVPLTMTTKIALESDPSTHWLAVLLGPSSVAREARQQASSEEPA